jgi:hypothetical protein
VESSSLTTDAAACMQLCTRPKPGGALGREPRAGDAAARTRVGDGPPAVVVVAPYVCLLALVAGNDDGLFGFAGPAWPPRTASLPSKPLCRILSGATSIQPVGPTCAAPSTADPSDFFANPRRFATV